ncbi:MAG TPA: MFS transporter [Bryobacteraceae bacterium]|nr:MFS transporter [Bryobacteraceae bacterium]
MVKRVFKAFEYRDFRLMWLGACTSSIGTWMQKLAQSWLVLELSKSSFLLGLDSFLGEIPILLFSLVGGVVADRRDRRHLLIASQLIQMTCAFLLAFLLATNLVKVPYILALSFCTGLAQAFGGPAYQALIPRLVKSEDLPNAIGLNSIQFNLARIIGPVIGGITMAKLGATWCFSLNGLSFIAVIISLLMLHERYVPAENRQSMLESMKEGINFIRKREGLEPLIVLAFLMTLLGVPLIVFLPVFARDVFQAGPNTYSLLLSVSGAGSVTGALGVATFGHIRQKGKFALVMLILLGTLIVGFSLSKVLWLSCVLLFIAGAALISCFVMISSLVQLITADEMRGRVMSVYNVAFRGGMPIGSLATGALIPIYSAPSVLAANGVLLAFLGLYFLLVNRKVAAL